MSGIKDLMGLHHWMDNGKRPALEKLLSNKRKISKQKLQLLKEIRLEAKEKTAGNRGGLGLPPVIP